MEGYEAMRNEALQVPELDLDTEEDNMQGLIGHVEGMNSLITCSKSVLASI